MSTYIPTVQEIWQADERTLCIVWNDQTHSQYDVVQLRKLCPCAQCVNEMTGERRDLPVDPSVRPVDITSVGHYALQIQFSDGHRTGIYSFDSLRRMHVQPT